MGRWHPNESFAPTQPLPEHQQRLAEQKRWRRLGRYVPNHVPLGLRLFYGVVALTWAAWAAIGLLSGHMYFLVSRGGPLHFAGLAAFVFSAAVLASAAACVITIADHYDRRDNEASYVRMRRRLWWAAAAFFVLACAVGLAQGTGLLRSTGRWAGLLPAAQLAELLTSPWLARLLEPHVPALRVWLGGTTLWFAGGSLVLRWLGVSRLGRERSPVVASVAACAVLLPVLVVFTLNLVVDLAAGAFAARGAPSSGAVPAQMAWMHSMLVACLGAIFMLLAVAAVGAGRWLRGRLRASP